MSCERSKAKRCGSSEFQDTLQKGGDDDAKHVEGSFDFGIGGDEAHVRVGKIAACGWKGCSCALNNAPGKLWSHQHIVKRFVIQYKCCAIERQFMGEKRYTIAMILHCTVAGQQAGRQLCCPATMHAIRQHAGTLKGSAQQQDTEFGTMFLAPRPQASIAKKQRLISVA